MREEYAGLGVGCLEPTAFVRTWRAGSTTCSSEAARAGAVQDSVHRIRAYTREAAPGAGSPASSHSERRSCTDLRARAVHAGRTPGAYETRRDRAAARTETPQGCPRVTIPAHSGKRQA